MLIQLLTNISILERHWELWHYLLALLVSTYGDNHACQYIVSHSGGGCIAIAGDGGLRQWQVSNRICHLAHVPDSFFAIRWVLTPVATLSIHYIAIVWYEGLIMELPVKQLYYSLLLCMMIPALLQLPTLLTMVYARMVDDVYLNNNMVFICSCSWGF